MPIIAVALLSCRVVHAVHLQAAYSADHQATEQPRAGSNVIHKDAIVTVNSARHAGNGRGTCQIATAGHKKKQLRSLSSTGPPDISSVV